MFELKRYLFYLVLQFHLFQLPAQLYLQIEKINSLETIKLGVGAIISFKAPTYSDQWQTGVIQDIIYESQTIVFDHTFLNIDEISKIKIKSGSGEVFAWMFKGFGLGWLTLGGIADLTNIREETNLDAQNVSIGLAALGTGIFLDKFAGDKIYTNKRTHRFRLLDLRFSED